MPKYQVALQRGIRPNAAARKQRSHRTSSADLSRGIPCEQLIIIDAVSLRSALRKAELELVREGFISETRIVSIQEVIHLDQSELTDDVLTKALQNDAGVLGDVDDYIGQRLDKFDSELADLIAEVAEALSYSDIIPGITVSKCQNGEGWVDYLMIEVFDEPSGQYYATGTEPDEVPLDLNAKDWDAVLSVARGLISLASERGLL